MFYVKALAPKHFEAELIEFGIPCRCLSHITLGFKLKPLNAKPDLKVSQ